MPTPPPTPETTPPSPTVRAPLWRVALLCRCPRCGTGQLFEGLLTVRQTCDACQLDLRGHDSGDGPAALAILVVSPIVVVAALWTEFRFNPPLWLHLLLWPALALALTIAALRPMKAAMIAMQYRHRASEMNA